MITLFATSQPERTDAISLTISLLLRLLRHLVLCLATTFGGGVLLAHFAAPQMVRLCAAGRPLGLAEFGLLYLWFRTLIDMWGYPARDVVRWCQARRMRKLQSIPAFATDSPKI